MPHDGVSPVPPRRLVGIIALIVLSIALPICVALFPAGERLASPRSAMSGAVRASYETTTFALCGASGVALLLIGIFLFRQRAHKWAVLLPIVGVSALVMLYDREVARIEGEFALRHFVREHLNELDALADAVAAGNPPATPYSVGSLTFINTELVPDGSVILFTTIEEGSSFRWGLVRSTEVSVTGAPTAGGALEGRLGGHHQLMVLSHNWFVLFNSYVYLKRGWS